MTKTFTMCALFVNLLLSVNAGVVSSKEPETALLKPDINYKDDVFFEQIAIMREFAAREPNPLAGGQKDYFTELRKITTGQLHVNRLKDFPASTATIRIETTGKQNGSDLAKYSQKYAFSNNKITADGPRPLDMIRQDYLALKWDKVMADKSTQRKYGPNAIMEGLAQSLNDKYDPSGYRHVWGMTYLTMAKNRWQKIKYTSLPVVQVNFSWRNRSALPGEQWHDLTVRYFPIAIPGVAKYHIDDDQIV